MKKLMQSGMAAREQWLNEVDLPTGKVVAEHRALVGLPELESGAKKARNVRVGEKEPDLALLDIWATTTSQNRTLKQSTTKCWLFSLPRNAIALCKRLQDAPVLITYNKTDIMSEANL